MFKDLDSWGRKGDGTVRGTKKRGFFRLQNGNDGGSLPDYREVSIGDGEVKKKGKIFSSRLPKMFEMQGRKSIRTHGRGVWTVADDSIYVLLSERFELRVDFMDLMKLSLDLMRLHATFLGLNHGVLTIETLGNGSRLGKSMVTKCNGLIRRLVSFLGRQIFNERPMSNWVGPKITRFNFLPPFFLSGVTDDFWDVTIETRDLWVQWIQMM
jgi:hypothetical protein